MIKVYIASPYSIGNKLENVRRSVAVAHELRRYRLCPFMPLLSHFANEIQVEPYETWLREDLEWLRQCDAVLRLDGESAGADREETLAKRLNIPLFKEIADLLDWAELKNDLEVKKRIQTAVLE
jgi:hypothetical protein